MVTTIRILRFLILLKLLVIALVLIALTLEAGASVAALIYPALIANALLALAAWMRWLEKKFGARYVPGLLAIAIVEQNVEYIYFETVRPFQSYLQEMPVANLVMDTRRNEMFFLVLVLTVLAAFEYGYRGAAWSVALASAVHLGISALAMRLSWVPALTWIFIPLQIILLVIVTFIVALLVEQQRAQQRELETAHRQLQHFAAMTDQLARSRERNRVARDLHDTLAHALTGLIVQLQAAQSLLTREPNTAHDAIAQAEQTARAGLSDARLAIRDLRTSPIASLGLIGALKQEIGVFEQASAATVALAIDEPLPQLRDDQEETLWRVAQEALHNIARHANARKVTIEMRATQNVLTLIVADDGIGFDPRAIPENHFGLIGMRERLALIGGELKIESARGAGTRVVCELEVGS
ncbi:MAG: sensor histidine kinase [Chloroflexi bacterium]|nr:sensor histidine kinase [Chloroflexota bacterium]